MSDFVHQFFQYGSVPYGLGVTEPVFLIPCLHYSDAVYHGSMGPVHHLAYPVQRYAVNIVQDVVHHESGTDDIIMPVLSQNAVFAYTCSLAHKVYDVFVTHSSDNLTDCRCAVCVHSDNDGKAVGFIHLLTHHVVVADFLDFFLNDSLHNVALVLVNIVYAYFCHGIYVAS